MSQPGHSRQDLVRDVVQAVLAANPTIGSGVPPLSFLQPAASSAVPTTEVGSSQAASGTLLSSLPSFASTFTLAPHAAVGAATSLSASTQGLAPTLPVVSPVLHQPFLVGPGCSPVPSKLVTQITSGKFVDLSELLFTSLVEAESDPQLFLDGRIVLTSTPKRQRRKVEDIVSGLRPSASTSWS